MTRPVFGVVALLLFVTGPSSAEEQTPPDGAAGLQTISAPDANPAFDPALIARIRRVIAEHEARAETRSGE